MGRAVEWADDEKSVLAAWIIFKEKLFYLNGRQNKAAK
jgi:hypothetical protein